MMPSYQGPGALQTPALAVRQTRHDYGVNPLRLLDQLREVIRLKHYSLRTEEVYVQWVTRFVHFCGLRHPRECGAAEVTAFLSHLASASQVAPTSTAAQASRRLGLPADHLYR